MSLTVAIPDTHVRRLSDAVLIGRLTRDLTDGFRSGNRTALVGGYPIVVNDGQTNLRDWADVLERRNPGTATVTRHCDGSTDVVLSQAVRVCLLPAGASSWAF